MPNKTKPSCPECGSKNSIATPSRAFMVREVGQVMAYRCRSCGHVFNDITGVYPEGEEPPVVVSKSSPLEGLSEPERIAKIKEILEGRK